MSKVTKPAEPKRPHGRPSKYTPELADEICERLANGEPLARICRDDHMPSVMSVWRWEEADETFSLRVARARAAGFDEIAYDMLHIADNQEAGVIRKVEGDKITETTEDMLGHRKLRVDTRAKLLACWDPKRYGTQRTEVDMTAHLPDVAKAASTLDEILGLLASK